MPSTYVTELSLRAAVNTTGRGLSSEGDQTQAIKTVANKRAKEQISGSSDISSLNGQFSAQGIAIDIAIAGLTLAFDEVRKQLGVLHQRRREFDQEREEGVATFTEPTNKEERDLSLEERVIKGFLKRTVDKDNLSFSTYLGIHSADLSTERNVKFNSVLPYYRMSESLVQPVASTRPLDRQRMAISLFFKSALPEAMDNIESSFQTDNKFVSFWVSTFRGRNYLNNRRAPRFIMMSLSNLLWNLQHPVDTEVGFPLSASSCIELCHKVESYLNEFLNPVSPFYLKKISNHENKLLSFMRKIEIHTKVLRAAYEEEQIHGINIDEVTNSAHRALRIMDKSVLKLIYKQYNPVSKKSEPDDTAAEKLSYYVGFLNELITQNSNLASVFDPCPAWVRTKNQWLNKTPQTVVDVLIIFSHLSRHERAFYLKKIRESTIGTATEFALTLSDLYDKFIKPIRTVSQLELEATHLSPKHEAVGHLTASRLIPLVTLVLEDYQINVDKSETYETDCSRSPERSTDVETEIMSGRQQVEAINLSANAGDKFYVWTLSPFVKLTGGEAEKREFDGMLKHQFRMTQMAKLMDSVKELVENYRSLLQHKTFQNFLLKCISKVKEEYQILERRIGVVQQCLDHDELISRSLQATLRPMMNDLNSSFEEFVRAAAQFERVVSRPNFVLEQRDLLKSKLKVVNRQFEGLFTEASGISDLVVDTPAPDLLDAAAIKPLYVVIAKNVDSVEAKQLFALSKLVQRCYDGLSSQSKKGHKGTLLQGLLKKMDDIPHFSQANIKDVIIELTHIVASYRKTSLFQAGYGQTRSAKILIKAIKDSVVNNALPLADIVFMKQGVNVRLLRDDDILQHIKDLRDAKGWTEAVNQIPAVATI